MVPLKALLPSGLYKLDECKNYKKKMNLFTSDSKYWKLKCIYGHFYTIFGYDDEDGITVIDRENLDGL